MRIRRLATELGIAALLVVLINAYLTRHAAAGRAPALPHTANLNGPVPAIGAGQPVIVDFWASWCPICRVDQGVIQHIARHTPVVVVATQSPLKAVERFAQTHHWHTPVIFDPRGSIAHAYGVHVLPMAFIIGAHGHIRFILAGYTTTAGLITRLWLARLHL